MNDFDFDKFLQRLKHPMKSSVMFYSTPSKNAIDWGSFVSSPVNDSTDSFVGKAVDKLAGSLINLAIQKKARKVCYTLDFDTRGGCMTVKACCGEELDGWITYDFGKVADMTDAAFEEFERRIDGKFRAEFLQYRRVMREV